MRVLGFVWIFKDVFIGEKSKGQCQNVIAVKHTLTDRHVLSISTYKEKRQGWKIDSTVRTCLCIKFFWEGVACETWAPFIRSDVKINQTVRGTLECINDNQIKLECITGRKLWKQAFDLISILESLECVIKGKFCSWNPNKLRIYYLNPLQYVFLIL